MSIEYWEQRYIYTEIHEILFDSFTTELQEYLYRLAEFYTCAKDDAITRCTPELVQQLEKSSNKITHAIDYWIDSILSGFVTNFAINNFASYSKTKRIFFKDPRGNFMCSLKLWIKILLCEKGTLCNHVD